MSTTATPIARSQSHYNATDIVRAILAPIASLRLTVFLLVLAVFVTWVVTLEQASVDIWELKNKHYNSLWVYVPINTFLPPNWFPSAPQIPFGIFLPSGLTIIAAMLMNLSAAHLLRFRIQAKGARLIIGIISAAAAAAVTWAVIFNHQDGQGFGGQPPIPWSQMWVYLQIVVLALAIGSVYAAISIGSERTVERIVYGLGAVSFVVLLGLSVIYGEKAFIGDSAMRILWQLTLSTISAMAVLAACMLLFNRKAGIVLLHLGIAGILANELYVTATNEELRVSFAEGETVHHAVDLRETEFVVIDRSNPEFDEMSVIPGDLLLEANENDKVIDDERMPFKIRCVDYYKNSDILRVGPFAENRATVGFGTNWIAQETRPAAGADANAGADRASAYVELIDRKTDKPIGTYLVSQAAYEQEIIDTVSQNENDYQIGLRYKTVYTPYALTLEDTQAEYYVGTETPSWFSSDFVIKDESNGVSSSQKIWMNNPLRYRDLTFYQTTYNSFEGKEYSGIQVVKNRGWMIPYVCCMFVVVGLVAQFYQTLTSHLASSRKKSLSTAAANVKPLLDGASSETKPPFWYAWGATVVLLSIFGLYTASKAARSISPKVTKAKGSDIRLDLLGRIPVTHGGRVQPLDSFARNTARRLGNRETVIDEFGKKQPAIRWLADSVFGAPAAEEYQVLRIEDLSVQNALGLKYRKGMKYTFAEIREANSKLVDQLVEADKLPPEQWTTFHKRLREVFGKTRQWMSVYTMMYGTDGRYEEGDLLGRIEVAANLSHSKEGIPLVLPTRDEEQPWVRYSLYREQRMLEDIAKEAGIKSNAELAEHILDEQMEITRMELFKQKIVQELIADSNEEVMEKLGIEDPQQLASALINNFDTLPKESYEEYVDDTKAFIDLRLKQWRSQTDRFGMTMDQSLFVMIKDIRGEVPSIPNVDPEIVENLESLKEAYLDGDAQAFNDSLNQHLQSVAAIAPTGWDDGKQKAEISYNHFSPFYMATVLYIVAFVISILSWIGLRQPLERAAFWLIVLALVVHLGGVASRVAISGRPPITNLYSSFVVVAAGSVLILLIVEYATKVGLGNLLASICGFTALLYAWTMTIDQGDTFTVLRAVLDTQFWLTTHVIIINLGYSATLVAGLIGVALLIMMFFNASLDKQSRKTFVNIIYGTTCFALLFSFFGTVLGGLWADDSWGRFWGWDPKENGALMIVLWNAVLLHARWAGMVKERGIAAIAALGNVIVMWSWEGVNQLGVGLHAYSGLGAAGGPSSIWFDSMFYLKLFCAISFVIAIIGMILPQAWFRSLADKKTAPA